MMHKLMSDKQAEQFHFAIKMGNIDYIKAMLADGASLLDVDSDGDVALAAAVKYGYVEVAKCLLNAGANVNFPNKRNETALHKASRKGSVELAECLLNAKANMSIANEDGDSALDVASKCGKLDVVEFLLSKGASTYTRCRANSNGDTTLHKAAKWNQLEVVKYLIFNHGMDINTTNEKEHDTTLHVAAKWGKDEVAELLLNFGADFTLKNRVGYTALVCAIKWENEGVEKHLRNAGAKDETAIDHRSSSVSSSSEDDPMKDVVMKNVKPDLLNLPTLIPILNSHKLLTKEDYYILQSAEIPPLQRVNKLLYTILPSKGSGAFTRFVQCLQKENDHLGHQELVNIFNQHNNERTFDHRSSDNSEVTNAPSISGSEEDQKNSRAYHVSNQIEGVKLQQQVLQVLERLEIKSPFTSNIMWGSCDHNGGVLISTDGIKLTIPKGAIKNGDSVKFYLATDLYGPFKLPFHDQNNLASPYYWIGINGSYSFQKPVQVEFEHFEACDLSNYQLLSCEDDDKSYTMQPVNYDFIFKVQDELSLCSFQTDHFCSYCIRHDCKHKFCSRISRIAILYLKPENFQYLQQFSVEIWLSFPLSYCLNRNKELFKKKGMKLDTHCSYIFEASCDKNSKSYFDLKYDQYIDGWFVDHSRSTEIKTKEVNFYNHYTNKEALQASEEMSLFPPRFVVNVVRKTECITDLNTSMTVTLYKAEGRKSVESIDLKLFVSISAIATKNPTSLVKDISLPSVGPHSCGKDEPTLKELVQYSKGISTYWKEIALLLAIPSNDISIIDLNNTRVEDKCYNMFKTWLERSKSPLCWCHFIQALCDVKLESIAKEARKHLERQSYENSGIVTAPQSKDVMGLSQSRGIMAPLPVITNESDIKNHNQGSTCTMKELVRYLKKLKDIPQNNFLYFISCLLPTESAANVIKDIRHSCESKEDSIHRVCRQFLEEKDPSWSKVCEALRNANSNDLAKLIEVTFIPD